MPWQIDIRQERNKVNNLNKELEKGRFSKKSFLLSLLRESILAHSTKFFVCLLIDISSGHVIFLLFID